MPVNTRKPPQAIQQMLLFRVSRFFGAAGGLATRVCEAEFGVPRREWGVMATLATHEGLLSSELAALARLDRARTSRALSRLEERGWVQRTPIQGDRRRIAVHLTEEGRRMYALILPRMAQLHTDLVAALDDTELAQFDAMLARLQQQAQALEHDSRYAGLPRVERSKGQR